MIDAKQQSENQAVRGSLLSTYCPAPIKAARETQDAILASRFKGQPYRIADVGCGTGYHGEMFGPSCTLYHGFEISPEMAAEARERLQRAGLTNAEILLGDVAALDLPSEFYDLVLCMYFTPGNFRDHFDDLSRYTGAYLDHNPRFIHVFSRFYAALKSGGTMLLTVYKDVPEAEAAQHDFYAHTGQHVVTPHGSRFVATAQRFWSARWTRESMLSNLAGCGIDAGQVVFHDLNEIAWLVEIRK